MIKRFFDFSRQYKQLQLEKPSGIEFDLPIHKRLAINLLLRVGQKGPPSGLIGLKIYLWIWRRNQGISKKIT